MKDLILSNIEEAGARILKEAGGAAYDPRNDTCIARFIDGELIGGVVYSSYTGRSCELHVAGFRRRWVNRSLLWITFAYPFMQLKLDKVFARVQASNEAALRFDLNIGFEVEALIKDVYQDGDMYILSMRKENCRHLDRDARRRSIHNEQA